MHPFSAPLKKSENLTGFLCFQGVEKRCIRNNWVKRFTSFPNRNESLHDLSGSCDIKTVVRYFFAALVYEIKFLYKSCKYNTNFFKNH